MRLTWTFLILVFSIIGLEAFHVVNVDDGADGNGEDQHHFLNNWVIEIDGGRKHAEAVAAQHGFEIERELLSIPNHYQLKHKDVPHRSKRSATHHTKRLADDYRIKFVEQQHEKIREKRGRYNRDLANHIARSTGELNDPKYQDQWYLSDDDGDDHFDMGVKKAWKQGVSGRNIKLTIIDDGIERTHPDLAANYPGYWTMDSEVRGGRYPVGEGEDGMKNNFKLPYYAEPSASYDFNDNDADPMPRYEITNENKHGTRCAGEIAMVANNGKCGVGVAFNSRIGGVRMLDGKVTDTVEGESIAFAKNVDISSASWGPSDNGETLEGPGHLGAKGVNESIILGRGGKGTILVWAAGNGAMHGDNCNCDGYTSDYRTLSVSSVSQGFLSPWYNEKCASTLTATYSSGNRGDLKVISSDLHNKCTTEHSGTSAAAPMAAGILALVLEKNPELTWRDVQHLVVVTSRHEPMSHETGWYKNGAGFCLNHAFGFGLIDADKLVRMAGQWENVPPQKICRVIPERDIFPMEVTSGNSIEVTIETDGCKGQSQEVNYLEHIQVIVTLDTTKRGNIYMEVESPSGTITPLMIERPNDKSTKGFDRWPLMSVHNWGENPKGTWKFRVADRQEKDSHKAVLRDVELVLMGTRQKPFYYDFMDHNKCDHLDKFPTLKEQEIEESLSSQMKHIFDGIDWK